MVARQQMFACMNAPHGTSFGFLIDQSIRMELIMKARKRLFHTVCSYLTSSMWHSIFQHVACVWSLLWRPLNHGANWWRQAHQHTSACLETNWTGGYSPECMCWLSVHAPFPHLTCQATCHYDIFFCLDHRSGLRKMSSQDRSSTTSSIGKAIISAAKGFGHHHVVYDSSTCYQCNTPVHPDFDFCSEACALEYWSKCRDQYKLSGDHEWL